MSTIKYDFSGLHDFVNGITKGRGHVVRVGIFGGKNSRQEVETVKNKFRMTTKKKANITNAEIGATHEFGSFSKGIPARSFLRMPIHAKSQQILREASVGVAGLLRSGKFMLILQRLGIACEIVIQQAFDTHGFGKWKANAPSTIRRKKSSAPLIDSKQLRFAIASEVV